MEPNRYQEKNMPSITVKNIPESLYRQLKASAHNHHRSINGEIISCLENLLLPRRESVEDQLSRVRAVRGQLNFRTTDTEIRAAKIKGRR